MLKSLIAALALLTASPAWSAGFLEREVYFSEADIQAQVAKNAALQKSYGNGTIVVALREAPRIRLGEPAGQVTIAARLHIALLGQPAVPVDVVGTAGLRYDDRNKAFFLDQPVARSVASAALAREAEPLVLQAVSQLMASYFRSQPVHVLREDGSEPERAARWLLRTIRIEPGRVAAILSPV
jgi:hypothetical protein